MDFLQEGWRLDMDKDKGDLAIKGVVFNEMKGAFADAQQVFGQKLLNSLLPSNTYGVCSGEEICGTFSFDGISLWVFYLWLCKFKKCCQLLTT